jgi:hypothetical protein
LCATANLPQGLNGITINALGFLEWGRRELGKSIFYRLFGLGKLPKAMAPIIEREGVLLEDQGLSGTVTFRKFRSPGRIYTYKKTALVGSIVITNLRFAVFAFSKSLINLPLKKDRLDRLELSVPKRNQLLVKFNAEDFHEDWKGTIECRFTTELAVMFLEKLKSAEA